MVLLLWYSYLFVIFTLRFDLPLPATPYTESQSGRTCLAATAMSCDQIHDGADQFFGDLVRIYFIASFGHRLL